MTVSASPNTRPVLTDATNATPIMDNTTNGPPLLGLIPQQGEHCNQWLALTRNSTLGRSAKNPAKKNDVPRLPLGIPTTCLHISKKQLIVIKSKQKEVILQMPTSSNPNLCASVLLQGKKWPGPGVHVTVRPGDVLTFVHDDQQRFDFRVAECPSPKRKQLGDSVDSPIKPKRIKNEEYHAVWRPDPSMEAAVLQLSQLQLEAHHAARRTPQSAAATTPSSRRKGEMHSSLANMLTKAMAETSSEPHGWPAQALEYLGIVHDEVLPETCNQTLQNILTWTGPVAPPSVPYVDENRLAAVRRIGHLLGSWSELASPLEVPPRTYMVGADDDEEKLADRATRKRRLHSLSMRLSAVRFWAKQLEKHKPRTQDVYLEEDSNFPEEEDDQLLQERKDPQQDDDLIPKGSWCYAQHDKDVHKALLRDLWSVMLETWSLPEAKSLWKGNLKVELDTESSTADELDAFETWIILQLVDTLANMFWQQLSMIQDDEEQTLSELSNLVGNYMPEDDARAWKARVAASLPVDSDHPFVKALL